MILNHTKDILKTKDITMLDFANRMIDQGNYRGTIASAHNAISAFCREGRASTSHKMLEMVCDILEVGIPDVISIGDKVEPLS